jgi:hypothetical protein
MPASGKGMSHAHVQLQQPNFVDHIQKQWVLVAAWLSEMFQGSSYGVRFAIRPGYTDAVGRF